MRHKNSSRHLTKTHSGFTLIELLVVISIAAIIMAIAVPSFSQLVGQQRVKAAANDFKSAVALARSEARKRDVNTSIRPIGKTESPWGTVDDGWYVYYNDDGTMKTVLEHQLESGSIQVTGGNAGFDLLGGILLVLLESSKQIVSSIPTPNRPVPPRRSKPALPPVT